MIGDAKALAEGTAPEAPWHPTLYTARPGSWFASAGASLGEVMTERFGHPLGRIEPPRTDAAE